MIRNFGEFMEARRNEQLEVFQKIKNGKPDERFGTYIPHNREYKDECPYMAARIYVWHEARTNWEGHVVRGDEVKVIFQDGRTTLLLIGYGGVEAEIVINHKRAGEYSRFDYDGIQQPYCHIMYRLMRGYREKDIFENKYKWFFERVHDAK